MKKLISGAVLLLALVTVAQAQGLYSENFDGGFPGNWTQSTTDAMDWTWRSGPTPSGGTGPTGDHTTGSGGYIYTEATGQAAGNDAVVTGPVLDGTGGSPMITFWYHMSGAAMGDLELYDYDGTNWNQIWIASGDQGAAWLQATVPLATYGPFNRAEFRFRSVRGASFTSDACIDDVSVSAPVVSLYQVNQPTATMDVNGYLGDEQVIASSDVYQSCPNLCINIASTLTGNGWDLAYAPGEAPSALGNSFTTGTGQIVNLDISGLGVTGPAFLHGGNLPALATTAMANTSLCIAYSNAPGTVVHAQMVVSDPTSADGISVSAPARAEWFADSIPHDSGGPTVGYLSGLGDDMSIEVPLGCLGTMDFCGTAYDSIFVNSNGTVSFGGGDASFTGSVAGALGGVGRVGFWSDLSPQLGAISVTHDGTGAVSVDFLGVPYFSPNTVAVSFSIDLHTSTSWRDGEIELVELQGIYNNPNTNGNGAGDAQWFGLSQGGGIADPGPTTFTGGGTGGPSNCLYEYTDGTVAPVMPPSLVPGPTSITYSITFSPDGMGGYFWVGI